jgi:hypothetical protein
MKIKKEITLSYIETLYEKLESDSSELVDIQIPFEGLKERNFSSLPSFILFFSTWLRSSKKGRLILDTEGENIESDDYNASIYSFITTCLNWDYEISNSQGEIINKSALRKLNTKFNKKQRNIQTNKGTELLLSCFDFDRTLDNRGLLNALYDYNGNLRDDDYFRFSLVPEILKEISKKFSVILIKNAFKSDDYRNLGNILYELFKNTHEWGRKQIDDITILTPNIRAIYCTIHKSTQRNFLSYAEGNNSLQQYLSHNLFRPNSKDEIYFLEISVFDSGIGFIKRFLNEKYIENSVSIDEQVSIVKNCMTKYFTTDQSLHSKHKGKGLDRVLQALDKKGFLRIRTENICLYRDLIKDDYSKIESQNINLYDWATESDSKFTKFAKTEGSTISMIYPINSSFNE